MGISLDDIAASAESGPQRKVASQLVTLYRGELKANPIFQIMDNGSYGKFKIRELMEHALSDIAGKLSNTAAP